MISVIIPTWNRAELLERALDSLLKCVENDKSNDLEIIVIDNGSSDGTKEVCEQFKRKHHSFVYEYDAEPGLLTGRHRGAELAKGEILCFLDEDVELSLEWLSGIAEAFRLDPDIALVTGPCIPKYQVYPPEWLNDFWEPLKPEGKFCGWLSLIDMGSKPLYIDPLLVWGLNFSIRKKQLFELEGFHPDSTPPHLQQFQGDGETGLGIKVKQAGLKAYYTPKAMLYHYVSRQRLTEEYFHKRAFYTGICESYTVLRQQHGLYITGEDLAEPKKVITNRTRFFSFFKKIKSRFKNSELSGPEGSDLKQRIYKSYEDGFNFHQRLFNEDKRVKEWVLKPTYWDYRLPSCDVEEV